MIKKVIDTYHIEYYCDFCHRKVEKHDMLYQGDVTGESPFGDLKDISFECCDKCKERFDGKDKVDVINEILKENIKYKFDKALNYYAPLNVTIWDKESDK